jgi:hypothetical protein
MKKTYFLLCMLVALGGSVHVSAQTNPGTTNLKHQWTFDGGSATDAIGGVVGTIHGTATLANNAFISTNGYMDFPAASIGINSYSELTVEVWCTSAAGKNTGWTMLSYFGETVAGAGKNYTFLSIARAVDGSMVSLETSTWNGATGPEYDDGKLHHFVYTVNATTIAYYIDGTFISSSPLAAGNTLASVSTSLAYLGRGGWTGDPNWIGSFHKFSIYDKALTSDEILYLYQDGAEKQQVISTTATAIAFDNNYPAETFNVSGSNLTGPITITTPAGIKIMDMSGSVISSLPANTTDKEVIAVWDLTTPVNDSIKLSSGNVVVKIPIKTGSDLACFNPLYTTTNLVEDPGLNNMSYFSGWGSRTVSNIINDPSNVYCGAASIKVGDGIAANSGSLNVDLTGKIAPNTTYRVRAMVKTIDGTFQLGVWGWSGSDADINNVINTSGEWKAVDFTFTTGATLGVNQGMFINNWTCTGTIAYADNWEMYIAQDPVISASAKGLAYDPEYTSSTFNATAANLSEAITITAPAGITVNPVSLATDAAGAPVTVTWNGTTAVNGFVTLASGTTQLKIPVKTVATSNTTCFVPLYTTKTNLIPSPYFNNPEAFAGWGGKGFISVIDNPDSVYCGSHSGIISGDGSMDVQLAGVLKKNTSYISRVMLMTIGGTYQLGISGFDARNNAADINTVVDTQGAWQLVTVEFTTGDSLRAGNVPLFVNKWNLTGRRALIDNWELYEKDPNAVATVNNLFENVYVQDAKIIVDFTVNQPSEVQLSVYSIQGALLSSEKFTPLAGRNHKELNAHLPSGMYLVKITLNGQSGFKKVII